MPSDTPRHSLTTTGGLSVNGSASLYGQVFATQGINCNGSTGVTYAPGGHAISFQWNGSHLLAFVDGAPVGTVTLT